MKGWKEAKLRDDTIGETKARETRAADKYAISWRANGEGEEATTDRSRESVQVVEKWRGTLWRRGEGAKGGLSGGSYGWNIVVENEPLIKNGSKRKLWAEVRKMKRR